MNRFMEYGLLGGIGGAFGGLGIGNRSLVVARTQRLWEGTLLLGYGRHHSDTREYDVARAQDMAFDEAGYREADEIAPEEP